MWVFFPSKFGLVEKKGKRETPFSYSSSLSLKYYCTIDSKQASLLGYFCPLLLTFTGFLADRYFGRLSIIFSFVNMIFTSQRWGRKGQGRRRKDEEGKILVSFRGVMRV